MVEARRDGSKIDFEPPLFVGDHCNIIAERELANWLYDFTIMADLAAKLRALHGEDPNRKEDLLAGIAELLTRSGCRGKGGRFSFHDPEIGALPDRLPDEMVRLIAMKLGSVLGNDLETKRLRAAAAFVLGKTHASDGLAAVMDAIAAPAPLPFEVARQCGFAFDARIETCGGNETELDLETIGCHFVSHGVPWNGTSQRVAVDEL